MTTQLHDLSHLYRCALEANHSVEIDNEESVIFSYKKYGIYDKKSYLCVERLLFSRNGDEQKYPVVEERMRIVYFRRKPSPRNQREKRACSDRH